MVLLGCVLGYFVMMGILTLYTTHKEKGIFLIAYNSSDSSRWEASSGLKKYDDQYELVLSYRSASGKPREAKSKRSVAQYFDENGTLVMEQVEPEVTKLHNSLLSSRKNK